MSVAPDWPTFHDLAAAYKSCRLHKPASPSQIRFELHLGESLLALHCEIHSGRYRPSPAKCFVVTQPKPREIFAADFRDRVVHHLVVSQLMPKWERRFIDASFACRTGKGSHGAIRHFQKKVRSLSRGGLYPVYALQLDIEKFFVSIHRPTLCDLLLKNLREPMLIRLITAIYGHDARVSVKRVGDQSLFQLIPPGKSWFEQAPDRGIPIGNLTSQFGANIYLTALDHYIQRDIKPQVYLRYMDDLLILSSDRERLEGVADRIDRWLMNHRHQQLNPSKSVLSDLRAGINYLGYRLKQTDIPAQPLQVFAEPLKKWRFIGALRTLEGSTTDTYFRPHRLGPLLPNPEIQSSLTSINSRLGSLRHARTFQFRKESMNNFSENSDEASGLPREIADPWERYRVKRGYRSIKLR